MPGGFHHFKHHVVLNILDKVEHSLPQSESTSKPACRGTGTEEAMQIQHGAHAAHGDGFHPHPHSRADPHDLVLLC